MLKTYAAMERLIRMSNATGPLRIQIRCVDPVKRVDQIAPARCRFVGMGCGKETNSAISRVRRDNRRGWRERVVHQGRCWRATIFVCVLHPLVEIVSWIPEKYVIPRANKLNVRWVRFVIVVVCSADRLMYVEILFRKVLSNAMLGEHGDFRVNAPPAKCAATVAPAALRSVGTIFWRREKNAKVRVQLLGVVSVGFVRVVTA